MAWTAPTAEDAQTFRNVTEAQWPSATIAPRLSAAIAWGRAYADPDTLSDDDAALLTAAVLSYTWAMLLTGAPITKKAGGASTSWAQGGQSMSPSEAYMADAERLMGRIAGQVLPMGFPGTLSDGASDYMDAVADETPLYARQF